MTLARVKLLQELGMLVPDELLNPAPFVVNAFYRRMNELRKSPFSKHDERKGETTAALEFLIDNAINFVSEMELTTSFLRRFMRMKCPRCTYLWEIRKEYPRPKDKTIEQIVEDGQGGPHEDPGPEPPFMKITSYGRMSEQKTVVCTCETCPTEIRFSFPHDGLIVDFKDDPEDMIHIKDFEIAKGKLQTPKWLRDAQNLVWPLKQSEGENENSK